MVESRREPVEALERADELLVIVRYRARGGGSGVELRRRFIDAVKPGAGSG